ncbi:MAG: CorA family divalent cation transporter [Christensenella sp.]|nr:CorA family divalent cation transporter [Christensenella sp.]
MLYEFSDELRQIEPEQLDEGRLTAGVARLNDLRGGFGARVGFGSALMEECEKTEGRFRSAVEMADGHLFAIVSVREISNVYGAKDRVALFVKKNLMLLVSLRDDDESIPIALTEAVRRLSPKTVSLERLISVFFERLLSRDGSDLEEFDDRVAAMEAQIENNTTDKSFNSEILSLRRRLLIIRNYYEQLLDLFDAMLENEVDLFSHKNLYYFRTVRDKISRLSANAQLLRDSLVQVREAYMAALDYSANRIMKVFTVVTTIFMPLTLIVGWYGMNFKFMPELASRYGYPAVIILSVLVVIFSFLFFRRKRLL